jgi:hypothetical protein
MPQSAYERIPVEIWDKILHYATASPLLPFREDGSLSPHLLDNFFLFGEWCPEFTEYRDETQVPVGRLRLVCRLWAQLLRKRVSEFALTNHEGHYYPSEQMAKQAKRLGIPPPVPCIWDRDECKYNGREREDSEASSEDSEKMREESVETFHLRFPNVHILDLKDRHMSPVGSLGTLVHLRSLALTLGLESDFSIDELSPHVPQLTHLKLRMVNIDTELLAQPFSHPNLQYLDLHFYDCIMAETETFALATTWTLPNLSTVLVSGPVPKVFEESVQRFVLRHASQLIGLSLTYQKATKDTFHGPSMITDPIWSGCWDTLGVFGIDILRLWPEYIPSLVKYTRESTSGDPCRPPFTVVVSKFTMFQRFHPRQILDALVSLQQSWKVDTFMFTNSWEWIEEQMELPWSELKMYQLSSGQTIPA